MPLLDFNSLVICNNFYRTEDLKETLHFFNEIGIKKFIVLSDIDPAFQSDWQIKNQIKDFKALLRSVKPRGALVYPAANVCLTPKVTQHYILKDMVLKNTNMLFIQAPPFVTNEWLQPDLNYLLYKQKLKPIFTCFERTIISCKPEVVTGLYKIRPASFCLDLDFIVAMRHYAFIKLCIRNGITILPSVPRDVKEYYPMVDRFQCFRDRIGKKAYLDFCRYINESTASVFREL